MGGDGSYGRDGSGWELWEGGKGQQHCCWESLRDYSLVKLKLQPSQTELLFRSVDDSFLPCGRLDHADGWAMRTDGPGYQPGQLTKEIRRNHQKRKKSKRKTSEKEKAAEGGGFIYSGRFCHSLYIILGQEHVGAFFH